MVWIGFEAFLVEVARETTRLPIRRKLIGGWMWVCVFSGTRFAGFILSSDTTKKELSVFLRKSGDRQMASFSRGFLWTPKRGSPFETPMFRFV